MTLAEKIATKPELERIDSSIESCFKILNQEIDKKIEAFALCSNMIPIYLKQAKKDIAAAENYFNQTIGKKPC